MAVVRWVSSDGDRLGVYMRGLGETYMVYGGGEREGKGKFGTGIYEPATSVGYHASILFSYSNDIIICTKFDVEQPLS